MALKCHLRFSHSKLKSLCFGRGWKLNRLEGRSWPRLSRAPFMHVMFSLDLYRTIALMKRRHTGVME